MQNKKIYILHHIKAPDSQNTNLKKTIMNTYSLSKLFHFHQNGK
mgnify:CR=1 FL=1